MSRPFSLRPSRRAGARRRPDLGACFSSQTVIKLRPDGSGTIEQTNLVNTAMIGMAAGMAKSMAGDKAAAARQLPKTDDLFSEEQLKKQAAQLGDGRALRVEREAHAGRHAGRPRHLRLRPRRGADDGHLARQPRELDGGATPTGRSRAANAVRASRRAAPICRD